MWRSGRKKPRILIVTPEITYLPEGMGNMSNALHAKAGGLADVSASLVAALFHQGADVHVTLPHYRKMFHVDVGRLISNELRVTHGVPSLTYWMLSTITRRPPTKRRSRT